MSNRPILILQMQRMGDLVLTFPLLLWLNRLYPDTPVWVVAERVFFEGLMPLSPQVTFFPREAAPALAKEQYSAVINLSHRPEAAALAGSVRCEHLAGPALRDGRATYIHGDWQLYRASLVHNNRHNLFHWADMNALDTIPLDRMRDTSWASPDWSRADAARVGLFVGASEALKHPSAEQWAKLVRALLNRGLKPVLLGGKADMPLGATIARMASVPALNLCGRFSLTEFVAMTRTLRYMITPDTGPMHVAAWTGTPVLNLSLGNVHPWETGPYQPGHHVLRSSISCTGCWHCKQPRPICHDSFSVERIAALTHAAIRQHSSEVHMHPVGQRLHVSARDAHGLYDLPNADGSATSTPRHALAAFWKAYFGAEFGVWTDAETHAAWSVLQARSPRALPILRKALLGLSRSILPALKGKESATSRADFWAAHPPALRPLTGYLHLYLQNTEYAPASYARSLQLIERILSLPSD